LSSPWPLMEFNDQSLKAAFREKKMGNPLYFFSKTESTNSLIFKLAEQGASEGTSVFADCQTKGKGRMKRQWQSPPGVNLYASVILKPEIDPALSPAITLMAGVAVAELLSSYCPATVNLKWPNDILVNNKKICGILSEIKTVGKKIQFIIVGIGLNVNIKRTDFPYPLNEIATSLREEKGTDLSRIEIAVKLFDNLSKYYNIFLTEGFGSIRERWIHYSMMTGKYCEVECGRDVCRGVVSGIDDDGALVIDTEDGAVRRIIAGDASIIKG
jgi:BirA family transcriptional regulator, biotin operon repressor / biotin---[acetyl-CoA-carboxylase] ligase